MATLEKIDEKLDSLRDDLHAIDKRLLVIETNNKTITDEIIKRIVILEEKAKWRLPQITAQQIIALVLIIGGFLTGNTAIISAATNEQPTQQVENIENFNIEQPQVKE